MSLERRSRKTVLKILLPFLPILLCIGCLGLFGFFYFVYFVSVPSPSITTTGKIYIIEPFRKIGRSDYKLSECEVFYKIKGETYRHFTTCGWFGNGDEVDVIYQTDKPQKAIIDRRSLGNLFGVLGTIFGLISFLVIRKHKVRNQ